MGGVGNEESLSGRAKFLLDTFCNYLKDKYTDKEIAELNVIDVGSYDGFLSHEISKKIKVKSITSLEPRIKNFQKGHFLRKELKISDEVIYRNGDLEELIANSEIFDVVFCVGVLHHISDLQSFITKLTKITNKYMFIEFITYEDSTKQINQILHPFLKRRLIKINNDQIETKDIIYSKIPKLYAISAFKAESNYLDGSTIDTSLVTLPSYEHVKLILYLNGFDSNLLVNSNEYRKNLRYKQRKFHAVILGAQKSLSSFSLESLASSYERYFIFHILPKFSIKLLIQIINRPSILSITNKILDKARKNHLINKIYKLFLNLIPNQDRLIWMNFIHNPTVKIKFEIAKYYFHNSNFDSAKLILNDILQIPNSDWRSCYRSLFLLALTEKGPRKSVLVEDLKMSNPNFPIDLLTEI
jgi:SAM-dependent methyltransferase